MDKRTVLRAIGIGIATGLAGCSGDGGSGSEDQTTSPSSDTDNSTPTDSDSNSQEQTSEENNTENTSNTGNEPGNYPRQETSGLESELDRAIGNEDALYGFKIDDYEFLNVEEFPDLVDEYEESSLNELAKSSTSFSLDEALYLAANMETAGESDTIYFAVETPETSTYGPISMYVNIEEQSSSLTDEEIFAVGNPSNPEGEDYQEEEPQREGQQQFFSNRVDPDGIVHAVDLEEHEYAVQALHSGFGSE